MRWLRLFQEAAYYLLVTLAVFACAIILYTLANFLDQ